MRGVSFTAVASHDLRELRPYIATLPNGPRVRFGRQVRSAFKDIAAHPFIGSPQSEYSRLMGEEVRSWLVAQYRIYYLSSGPQPVIIGILHTARDHAAILRGRIQ